MVSVFDLEKIKARMEEIERLADEVAGIMYKRSDCDDDVTWLPSERFHEVAIKLIEFLNPNKAAQSKTLENDPKPDENDYYTGAPDVSGEIYDQFLSQEYNHDLNEWQKRQAMGMSKNEYYLRCAWDATSAKLEEATSQIKALTAIKKGLESSLTECMEKLKAAQSKPADQDSEAIWTKALNDAYDVWEAKGKEGEFSLVVVNHLRANYDLKEKPTK